MSRPVRLQLSRRKGFNLQAHSLETNGLEAIVVARPTKHGNPYDWREWKENIPRDVFWTIPEAKRWCCEQAVQSFKDDVEGGTIKPDLSSLHGKNLACWCDKYSWCHADVLLELANK